MKVGDSAGGPWEVWRVAYPLILNNAAQTLMTFVDRAFLAKRSTEDVAAALPGGLLSFTFMSFFVVTIGFASTLVAQRHGKEDREGCVQATWAAFHLSLIAGLFCVGVSFLGPWIIQLSSHPESVMWREKIYFQMLVPGGGFECMNMAFCAFFAGQSRTWVVSLVSLIKCSVNAVLAYAFIFGKWGAPEMGIAGAGLATFLATALGPFISGAFFLMQDQSRFRTRHLAAPSVPEILRLLRFGSRSGVQVLLDVAAWSLVLFVVGDLGQSALAATTIAMSINMISFMPLLGVSDATSILVGQYIGRGSKEISTRAAFTAWKMAGSYMVLMAVVFLALPQHLFRFFQPTGGGGQEFQEVMGYARSILACAACYNFFDATIFVFMGALRGAGDTKGPMWIMLCLAWGLLVPGTLWMIKGLHCTVLGLWVFITCYAFLVCLMMFRRFQSGQWKKIDVFGQGLPGPPPVPEVIP